MKIAIDQVKQSERVYRHLFPQIPAGKDAKSFKAFWRQDKNPSASFFKAKSGDWVINDFTSNEGYDLLRALKEFQNTDFKKAIDLIASEFSEYVIQPEKTPVEWAKKRNIPLEKLNIVNNEIAYKYFDWKTNDYLGSKIREFGQLDSSQKRFRCKDGLSLTENFYHVNLGQSKRLYIVGGEGDCIALSQKVSDPCVALPGESKNLAKKLIDCINYFKFEEVVICYDNPEWEPENLVKVALLAKELIQLNSVNLVYSIDWTAVKAKGFGQKDIASVNICGDERFHEFLGTIKRLEFKPLDEDVELLKQEFQEINSQSKQFNLFDFLPFEFATLFENFRQCIDPNFPPEAVLSMFMSIVGGLMGTNFKMKEGYKTNKAIIWTVLSIGSSSGKSDVLRFLTEPIVKEEVRLGKQHLEETQSYERALNEWKVEKKEKRNTPMPKLPVRKRFLSETFTIESIRRDHGQNPDGLIVSAGELAGFFNSFGQYKGGKGDDRQAWLQFHSGEAILVSRVDSSRDVSLSETAISIVGAIQPHILSKVLVKDLDSADGLFTRFLYLDYEGYKLCEEPNKLFEGSSALLARLYEWIILMRQGKIYEFELDNSTGFKDNISVSLKKAQNQAPDPITNSYVGKQFNQWKAICLFFHTLECFTNKEIKPIIGLDSQRKAARMIKLFQEHFKKILLRNTERGGKLGIFQKIIQLKENEIKPSRIVSSGWAKNTKDAVKIFDEMEKMGFGFKQEGKRGSYIFIKKGEN